MNPQVEWVKCQYCGTSLHVERARLPRTTTQQQPANVVYVPPAPSRALGCVLLTVGLGTVALPLALTFGPSLARQVGHSMRPFPAVCSMNEELHLSGDFTSDGVLIQAAHNCKITIEGSKLKGKSLLDANAFNVEVTLKNVTLETSETSIRLGSNAKIKVEGGSIRSEGWIFEIDANPQLDLQSTKLEGGKGIATDSVNLKLSAEQTSFRAGKSAFELGSNADLRFRKEVELIANEVGIQGEHNLQIRADAPKLQAGDALVVSGSSAKLSFDGAKLDAGKRGFVLGSVSQLTLNGGQLLVQAGPALDGRASSVGLSASGARIESTADGFLAGTGARLTLANQARLVSSRGSAFVGEGHARIELEDATVTAERTAVSCGSHCKLTLTRSELQGKTGGVKVGSHASFLVNSCTIQGGSGPGIAATYATELTVQQGTVQGAPALLTERRPNTLELAGVNLIGGQRIPGR